MRPLEMQSIDTGMGIERFAGVLQGTNNVFETDLMLALVEASAHATSTDLSERFITHHRVIADHLRSTSFLIAEGVLPSNEGRGYVLRRIMRRAMRHAHLLGVREPVMHRLVPELVRQMGDHYGELVQGQAMIEETLRSEETRFRQTLDRGLRLLDDELARAAGGRRAAGRGGVQAVRHLWLSARPDAGRAARARPGREYRGLHQRHGRAEGQGARRLGRLGRGRRPGALVRHRRPPRPDRVPRLRDRDGRRPDPRAGRRATQPSTRRRDAVQIVVNQTPFYAEAGGQVGDTGTIATETGAAEITDTKKVAGVFIHVATVTEGSLRRGQGARLTVDHARRCGDPLEPFRHAPAARGAARAAGRACRAARLAERARPAAVRLQPQRGAERRRNRRRSRRR